MVDDNFIFKFGKYSGKTYKYVLETNPQYISWAEENAPNLLKEKKAAKPKDEPQTFIDRNPKKILPNLNFDNETD